VTDAAPRRIVLDTQVALDLLHFGDPRTRTLRAALDAGRVVIVSDAACRAEFLRVLHYPALRIDAARRAELEGEYDDLVVLHAHDSTRAPSCPPLPRCADPDDQKFLELAEAAGAAILLSRDAALLRLAVRCARVGRFEILPASGFTD
jgi:predicted nucleic acid-binding protein